jgi:bifunctional non-homologous end joining protein LigD
MALTEYQRKRKANETPEPQGGDPSPGLPTFVVQKHHASRLHYDFRLEHAGVLKSWAVPKGPALDPKQKRLAMKVEDHPLDYRLFEGIIPKGNYGAGTVMVWDSGSYATPDAASREDVHREVEAGLHKGHVAVFLSGHKLRGLFDLIKTRGSEENAWLLVKREDEFSSSTDVLTQDRSVLTGRNLDEIRSGAPQSGEVWFSDRQRQAFDLVDTPTSTMPRDIRPMLATEVDKPFDGDDWLFELKWDGYRAIAEVEPAGDIRLYSRNGQPYNDKYPELVSDLRTIDHACVLDGEIVCVDKDGIARFQWLQDYGRQKRGTLLYYAFDLLYLDGHDLRKAPLIRRKALLRDLMPDAARLRVSDHILGRGRDFFGIIRERQLEGIMAKRVESPYCEGTRNRLWIKVKNLSHQLAIVCGYTEGRRSRRHFGALVLGVCGPDGLDYIGHTGGGFDEAGLTDLMGRLHGLETEICPFATVPKTNMPATWVTPEIVVDVAFRGWTESGLLRQPIFMSIVGDTAPSRVTRGVGDSQTSGAQTQTRKEGGLPVGRDEPKQEAHPRAPAGAKPTRSQAAAKEQSIELDGHRLRLTNCDKELWPGEGITKGDLIDYYLNIAPYILPNLVDRPESLHRHPNGINQKGFFQKDTPAHTPAWIQTVLVDSESQEKAIRYLLCQNTATLVYLANLACIELNPWFSTTAALDQPDFAVIDLDPHEVGFEAVVETALVVKSVLDELGIVAYPKTSGSSGIHIAIPLARQYGYEQAKQLCLIAGQIVHERLPALTSLERSPAKRVGRIYLDCLQNRPGQTLAAVYSVRPKPLATVSTPLHWDEVNTSLEPRNFTIRTIVERVQNVGDLWKPVLGEGIDLPAVLSRLT